VAGRSAKEGADRAHHFVRVSATSVTCGFAVLSARRSGIVTLSSLRDVVWHGARADIGAPICRHLAEHARLSPEMQADFLILPQDWSPRLAYWAQVISGLQRMPELLPPGVNIPPDWVVELAPVLESYMFDMRQFDATPPKDARFVNQ